MAWPSIIIPSSIEEILEKPVHITKSEAGYPVSRSIASATLRRFILTWDAMSAADKATLITYFDSTIGGSDTWTHPETSVAYTVIFAEGAISFKNKKNFPGWHEVSITLQAIAEPT